MTQRAGSDVIVVGAGIVGAACAARLARDGWRVTILDRSFASAGTTSVGMGHIVVMDDSPEQLALTAYAARQWRDLRPELGPRSEYDACGTLWIAEDAAQLAALEEKRNTYVSAGVAAEVIDGSALRAMEPMLRRDLLGALLVPDDAVVYPPGATLDLLDLARRHGAVLREGADVRAIVPHGVMTRTETLHADVVINAAGAMAPSLTPDLPIVPRKGHLAITDRARGMCRHQIVELGYLTSAHAMTTESVAFNVQPRSTGQVLIGSSRELVGWDASLNHDLLSRMLSRAVQLMPGLRTASIVRCWTGFRPATPDKLPLIGAWEPTAGSWIAGGHEGLGITLSLATAAIIADQVAGRSPALDASALSPMRVLSQRATA